MKIIDIIAAILLIIGGLSWGLVGLFGFNLVSFLFGGNILENIIYILIGASAVWQAVCLKCIQERWHCR